MISISYLFEDKLKDHIKRHWGKYAAIGGGLGLAGAGGEAIDVAVRRAAKGGDPTEPTTDYLKKGGKLAQKFGATAAGGGLALSFKDQLDTEERLKKLKEQKKKKKG